MNKSLQNVWKRTPDDIYLQPSWDYKTYAFETLGESALWYKQFKHPVVAVFDVVLQSSGSSNPKPIVLLQPRPKLQELFPTRAIRLEGIPDKTAINRIGDSLFAMGHLNYPLVNLAPALPQIGRAWSEENQGCDGLECYTGIRYTEREGAKSRISRLIEAGPGNNKSTIVPRAVAETNFENPLPTPSEITAIPLPSRSSTLGPDGKFIGLLSQSENTRSKPETTQTWTLALPFVGGFLAIWLLLRTFLKTAPTRPDRLIQPLQNASSSTDVTTSLSVPSRSHSQYPSTSGIVYPAFAGATTYAAADSDDARQVASASRDRDSSGFDEKRGLLSKKDDEVASLSLALEDARVGSGLGISIDVREAEESEGDEGDAQDNKKRTRRGKRGKNRNKKPKLPVNSSQIGADTSGPTEQTSAQDSGSASADYVTVDQRHADKAPIKMELPLPVTTSSSSLVVTSKVLGTRPLFLSQ
jgi:serine/threonine-protein kinase/endoribonuclease IRE1